MPTGKCRALSTEHSRKAAALLQEAGSVRSRVPGSHQQKPPAGKPRHSEPVFSSHIVRVNNDQQFPFSKVLNTSNFTIASMFQLGEARSITGSKTGEETQNKVM